MALGTGLGWMLASASTDRGVADPNTPRSGAASEELEELREEVDRLRKAATGSERSTVPSARREPMPGPDPNRGPLDTERAARLAAFKQRRERIQAWKTNLLQVWDSALRERTLSELRAALRGGDTAAIEAALRTLTACREVEFDKTAMRDLVLPHLTSRDPETRHAAMYALFQTNPTAADRERWIAMANDPSPRVRGSVAHVLNMGHAKDLTGPVSQSIERLLDDPDPDVRKQTRTSLWGAKVGPRIEQRLLARARDPKHTHDAIYFGLSTFRDKSVAVVDALANATEHPDRSISRRALWGLGHGVSDAAKPKAADAFVRLLRNRSAPELATESIERIGMYGNARHVAALQEFAAGPMVPDSTRNRIAALIRQLQKRPWR